MKSLKILSILTMLFFATIQAKISHKNKKEHTITPQELLKSKKWNIQGKSVGIYYEYTQTEKTLYVDGTDVGSTKYYISNINCFEKLFNANKVGQTSTGRFLITEENCYFITVIDNSKVQISFLSHENPTTTTLIAKE